MEIKLLDVPDGKVLARGVCYGGWPKYEFAVADDGHVYYQAIGVLEEVGNWWAARDSQSFLQIVSVWLRYQDEIGKLESESAQLELVARTRQELMRLGALLNNMPPGKESLWSYLLFEAKNGLG